MISKGAFYLDRRGGGEGERGGEGEEGRRGGEEGRMGRRGEREGTGVAMAVTTARSDSSSQFLSLVYRMYRRRNFKSKRSPVWVNRG